MVKAVNIVCPYGVKLSHAPRSLLQGVRSVAELVAEWIVALERDTRIVSNFHIFDKMPLSCMCKKHSSRKFHRHSLW